jgi:hypothetical protein
MCDNCGSRVPRPIAKEHLDTLTRSVLARAVAHLTDIFNEFDSRYQDADSHALIAELRLRTRESLLLLCPYPKQESDASR